MLRLKTFGGLWVENSAADSGAKLRPRSLALLAVCAAAGPKGVSRDRILGVLWPESHPERARHALSQTLYNLKRDLGAEPLLSSPDLRVDPTLVSSDVADFREAFGAKRWADATMQYAGPFLDGFYLADAPEFERWAEAERASLEADAKRAMEAAAAESAGAGEQGRAVELLQRLTQIDAGNSRYAARYMEALAAHGDRAGAVAHGRAHMGFLEREFDLDPDTDLEKLIARLRESPPAGTLASVAAPRPRAHQEAASTSAEPLAAARDLTEATSGGDAGHASIPKARPPWRQIGRGRVVAAASVLVAFGVVAAVLHEPSTSVGPQTQPVLAVGRIEDFGGPDSMAASRMASAMLATSLARFDDVAVVTSSRLFELVPRNADTSRSALVDAARRAGATEIVEGEFIALPNHVLQLDARRVDVTRRLVRAGYRVSGADRVALLDSVTSLIAADLGAGRPRAPPTQVSTRSPVAFRLYEEGLRAFFRLDAPAASRLFRAAMREDSTFAMAVYYAWRSAAMVGDSTERQLALRAQTLASTAPARDRLLIVTHVRAASFDVRALASAETLAARFPADPEALIRAAEALPDLSRSIGLINQSIALDSAAGDGAICRLCDALNLLIARYVWADSDAAVERTFTRWRALRPHDAQPWGLESDWLIGLKRRVAAESAMGRFKALGGSAGEMPVERLVRSLRMDDFRAVDSTCDEVLATHDPAQFIEYRWYCTLGLRMEGRYRDALGLVRDGRVPRSGIVRREVAIDGYNRAILDWEMGRPATAADQFMTIAEEARAADNRAGRVDPRVMPWLLTLAASAFVAGGDTVAARRLVDSIEVAGSRSAFPRDPLLHHFVRGLLYARARRDDAALREYRAAISSPTFGFTRINYELGKTLLTLQRPGEGIPLVQAALHGGIEGSGLYVTHTELHELLAQLFDAAGQRDSAAAHYRVVVAAWSFADPVLWSRRDAAARRVAAADRPTRH